ncbi:MAG TPA: hypothetical protein VN420_03040 [Candidatus Fimivivens sp.]|nr:hypothetical protein [Candidatus Fimivivens sp.]
MRKNRKTTRGFTIGEVVLSIGVLVVGILPIFAAMNGGLKATMKARDIVIASGLAQEGVELVKNVKDNRTLIGQSPTTWLPNGAGPWNNCRIDSADAVLTPGSGSRITCGATYDLAPSASTGLFAHTGSTGRFKRRMLLSYDTTTGVIDCVSAAYWGTYAGPSSIADARSNCVLSRSCVYTEAKLASWE